MDVIYDSGRMDEVAIRFDGEIDIPESGEWTFYTNSDDGTLLYIDQEIVVDNDGFHGDKEKSGSVELEAGKHQFSIDYFDGHGGSMVQAKWEGPNVEYQIIPAVAFSH